MTLWRCSAGEVPHYDLNSLFSAVWLVWFLFPTTALKQLQLLTAFGKNTDNLNSCLSSYSVEELKLGFYWNEKSCFDKAFNSNSFFYLHTGWLAAREVCSTAWHRSKHENHQPMRSLIVCGFFCLSKLKWWFVTQEVIFLIKIDSMTNLLGGMNA